MMHAKKQQGWVNITIITLLAISSGVLAWFYFDNSASQKELQVQIKSLQATAKQAKRSLEREQDERARIQSDLTGATSELNTTRQQLRSSTTEVDSKNTQLLALQAQITELETQASSANAQLAESQTSLATLESELSKAASTEELYMAAREALALEQAENESYEQTIARLKKELDAEAKAMAQLEGELQAQLAQLNQEKETLVTKLKDGTTAIKLPESILFATGSAEINDDGVSALTVLAKALASFPNHLISIQGHTDGRQISSQTALVYPTNWELSSARASSAVRVLIDQGITASQLQAVGLADTRPIVEENNAQARQTNRRIEVILLPNQFTTQLLPSVE